MISVLFLSLLKPVLPAAGSWHGARAAGHQEAQKEHKPPRAHAKPAPGLLPEPEVSPDLGSKPLQSLLGALTGLGGSLAPLLGAAGRSTGMGSRGFLGSAPTEQLHRPSQPPGRTAGSRDGWGTALSGAVRAWMETARHRCAAWVLKLMVGKAVFSRVTAPL